MWNHSPRLSPRLPQLLSTPYSVPVRIRNTAWEVARLLAWCGKLSVDRAWPRKLLKWALISVGLFARVLYTPEARGFCALGSGLA